MDILKCGMTVEICPYREGASDKVRRDYRDYDGCSGPVVDLYEGGSRQKVRVKVESSNASLAGGIDVPVSVLKVLKEQEKA